MAFASPTLDEIKNAILRDIRLEIPGAVTVPGSDYHAMATVLATSEFAIYANGSYLSQQALPQTADDKRLADIADNEGVAKLGAAYASGTALITSSYPLTVADGSRLSNTATGARYKTVGVTAIGSTLQATVNLIAIDTGESSDANPNTTLNFEAPVAGLNPVATVVSISGGASEWSRSRWATEIIRTMRARPGSGNIPHLIAVGNSIPGVEQTFVYPALRGPGTLDIVPVTSAASGSRVAGTAILNKLFGALQFGVRIAGGATLPGIPEDVFANTHVSAAVAQATAVIVKYRASVSNPFSSWPPADATHMRYSTAGDEASFYTITSTSSPTSLTVSLPTLGTPVAPQPGDTFGVFIAGAGFVKGTIATVTGSGPWNVTMRSWSPSLPSTVTSIPTTPICPWSEQLTNIAGAPSGASLALSGAVPEFFASLGPGEMTTLTSTDVTRRRRWPRPTDTSPISGLAEWPTDITGRLAALLSSATDGQDFVVIVPSPSTSTPSVPSVGNIGTPPSILTLSTVTVVPF